GAWASRVYRLMSANPANDFNEKSFEGGFTAYEMIFADTTKDVDVTTQPLSYFNPGSGRFLSKSSLSDPNAYLVASEMGTYSFDHFGYANGDVRLYRGSTCLLCPAAYRVAQASSNFRGEAGTTAFSTCFCRCSARAPRRRKARRSLIKPV